MSLLLQLLAQFLRRLALLCRKDGLKAVVAQNHLLTQQLIALNRGRKRAPSASPLHRICLAFFAMFMSVRRLRQSAVVFRPSTLLRFRDFLTKQKYRFLFSPKKRGKPGPKGPSPEIITAVVEFNRRNPSCGCPRIAQQISDTFRIDLHPDVVRRILIHHFKPGIDSDGPSWLTFLGHSKDSLWSMDFFTTESVLMTSYSVMVVMDQFSRRIVGFAVHRGQVDDGALCFTGYSSQLFTSPNQLSTPLYLTLSLTVRFRSNAP